MISLLDSPLNLASLAERLVEKYGMKYSTARPAVTRIYGRLIELGFICEVGTDKRGSKIVDLSPKGLSILVTFVTSYGSKCVGLNYTLLRKAIERICPELLSSYDDMSKIFELIDAERECEGDPLSTLESEFFWAVDVEEAIVGEKNYTCNEVETSIKNAIETSPTIVISELGMEKALEIFRRIASLQLSHKTRELLIESISREIKELNSDIKRLRERINILKQILSQLHNKHK
jgi:hypothetical protein